MKANRSSGKVVAGKPADSGASRVHLVYGDDEYKVSHAAREMVNRFCPVEEQALGLEVVDGRASNAAEASSALARCIEGLQTVGFFGGRKVVWLRDANLFADAPATRAEEVKELVLRLTTVIQKGLAEGQLLVISAGKVDGRSSFFKACKISASVREYSQPEQAGAADAQAGAWARQIFERNGLRVDGEVVDVFLARTGTDSRQILQEVEKLAVYLGDRKEVRHEDVVRLIATSREAMGWDLADAVGDGDLSNALQVLDRLLFQGVNPIALIVGLENRVRDLLLYRVALDRGWIEVSGSGAWPRAQWRTSPEADGVLSQWPKDPRRVHPARAGRLAGQARRFTERELLAFHEEVAATHEQLVSSAVPAELLIHFLLVRMLSKRNARAS